ncbi:Dihydrofolate synthase @ Folylpolyglutamate synthase [hydrothermal vent metagenome]|uniref:tetrahydrofolate synthase n=1 Tax=hydrothermal vent metagenome TaxID=652676 RepID=A0A3B0TMB1_9ZZZZ
MSRTDVILERLLKLHPNKLIDLKLNRVERLLEALGRPQDRVPPVIHVAGTNGKGSTIAHLRAFLEAAGKKVHVYTSPHLVNFNERIRLAGRLVSNDLLSEALEVCEEKNASKPITYFEITTAAAFHLFAKVKADYLLLEVGLGGRFDATNVIANPYGTIITPVSIDHVEFLGNDLASIAHEKSGILKAGSPAVIGRQPEEAVGAIEKEANRLGVDIKFAGQDFDFYPQHSRLVYQDEFGLLDLLPSGLNGDFQNDNAALAIAAVRFFDLPVDEKALEEGLKKVSWPGRLMQLKKGDLADRLHKTQQLWLDGGHNEAAGNVLAKALKAMPQIGENRPLVLILGAYANKDMAGFLKHFEGMVEKIITIKMEGARQSWSAKDLAEIARSNGFEAQDAEDIETALALAGQIKNARIVICGSLHLAGDVLFKNKTPIT